MMRRLVSLLSLCTLLIGISAIGTWAQTISVINDGEMMIDVNLRDADLTEVLTALFNTTNGKYQLRMGNNVVGRINRLSFAGVPFDSGDKSALNTILKAAGTFSVLKEAGTGGTIVYTINGPSSAVPAPTPPITPVMAPPTTDNTKSTTTASNDFNPNGFLSYATNKSDKSSDPNAKPGDTSSGSPAGENEISVVKMLGINYIDLVSFTQACGYSSIALFVQNSNQNGGVNGVNNGVNGINGINNGLNNGINNGINNGLGYNSGINNGINNGLGNNSGINNGINRVGY